MLPGPYLAGGTGCPLLCAAEWQEPRGQTGLGRSPIGCVERQKRRGKLADVLTKVGAYADPFATKSGRVSPRASEAEKNAGVRRRAGDRHRYGARVPVLQLATHLLFAEDNT